MIEQVQDIRRNDRPWSDGGGGDHHDRARPIQSTSLNQVMFACLLGQIVEWYDYGLYGLLARQIGGAFFPSGDETSRLLAAFGVFGVAFLARPIGGMLMGRYGDRAGRKRVLVASLILMTLATGIVGIIPGARVVGLMAPILLVGARIAQGISAAGESTSAITYVSEMVPSKHRGFYAALLISGNSIGFLLAEGVIWAAEAAFGDTAFDSWGWRLPFLIALPLGFIGFYIRRRLGESPVFEALRRNHGLSPTPLRDTFTVGLGHLFQGIGIGALAFVANYLVLSFMPTHLRMLGFSTAQTSAITISTILVLMIAYPIMGAVSDLTGRKALMMGSAGFFLLFGWPLFAGMRPDNMMSIFLCMTSFAIGTAAYVGILGVMYNEFLASSYRMAGYSTGFNISGAVFGSTSLWVFEKLASTTGDLRTPIIYVVIAAFISLISLWTIRLSDDADPMTSKVSVIANSVG